MLLNQKSLCSHVSLRASNWFDVCILLTSTGYSLYFPSHFIHSWAVIPNRCYSITNKEGYIDAFSFMGSSQFCSVNTYLLSSSRVIHGVFPRLILSWITDLFWSVSIFNREFIIHWKSTLTLSGISYVLARTAFPVAVCTAAPSRCRWTYRMNYVSRSYCSSSKK